MKLKYIEAVCRNEKITLSENAANELFEKYNKQFFDELENKELLDLGLVFYSGKYIVSDVGDGIIENAAKLFYTDTKPEPKNKIGPKKRDVTDKMVWLANLVIKLMEPKVKIREVKERRSNLDVKFECRYKGIGMIEIMNSGILRVTVYKPTHIHFKLFEEFGMTYRTSGKNTYFDTELNDLNVVNLTQTLLQFFEV